MPYEYLNQSASIGMVLKKSAEFYKKIFARLLWPTLLSTLISYISLLVFYYVLIQHFGADLNGMHDKPEFGAYVLLQCSMVLSSISSMIQAPKTVGFITTFCLPFLLTLLTYLFFLLQGYTIAHQITLPCRLSLGRILRQGISKTWWIIILCGLLGLMSVRSYLLMALETFDIVKDMSLLFSLLIFMSATLCQMLVKLMLFTYFGQFITAIFVDGDKLGLIRSIKLTYGHYWRSFMLLSLAWLPLLMFLALAEMYHSSFIGLNIGDPYWSTGIYFIGVLSFALSFITPWTIAVSLNLYHDLKWRKSNSSVVACSSPRKKLSKKLWVII